MIDQSDQVTFEDPLGDLLIDVWHYVFLRSLRVSIVDFDLIDKRK